MASNRTPFLTIRAEGALLPVDLLQRIVEGDSELGGLTTENYHLSGEKLNEAINRSWNRLVGAWAAFNVALEKDTTEHGTGMTRDKWLLPLFQELNYGQLLPTRTIAIDGKEYPISHQWNEVPIHLLGWKLDLDKRTPGASGAAKASPHSLVQELLNRSDERTWGFVSNGLRLRALRDNASLTRQAYLEFDLEAMMNGEVYADFVVLWLVCHQSRVETAQSRETLESCWLEKWSKAAQERGTRALDGLRVGVEKAIEALGKGFIGHPANGSLRGALSSGAVSTLELYRQLLRLVYRLIFLFVAEDRQLLYDPASDAEFRERYVRFYSTARLRRVAERVRGSRHADLYVALKLVMDKLGNGGASELGLPALGGFLFSHQAMSALADCELSNEHLLEAVRSLAFTQDGRTRRAVDYKNLGARELGSVYESLLELHPTVNTDAGTFALAVVSGSERKTTGSFFTPEDLINILLDSALNPVIEQAISRAGNSVENQIRAILNLKVCDPACGSGHFLIAAARRLARRLAQLQTGEGEPAPEAMRSALRAVISNCIYGVDINPMSVELCKVSLWMETLEPGKPLSFLDAHIQCGDSLVGGAPGLDISEIPDEAFNPAFGDDKATSTALKKRNKRVRTTGQMSFLVELAGGQRVAEDVAKILADRAAQVDAMPEDDSTQVQAKAKAFDDYHHAREYLKGRLELDLWTAAFFWSIPKADAESMLAPTQQELIQLRNGGELDARLMEKVHELANRLNFFHWELAFPNVFSDGDPGFDCALGNPPWEMLQLEEQEFFASRDPDIASLPGDARKRAIINLKQTNPMLADEFEMAKHYADAKNKFLRSSNRYPFTATGKMNTYALFAEHVRLLLSSTGRSGVVLPTGIATDDTTKFFFGDLVEKNSLAKIVGFENEAFIFPSVHHAFKFCAFIMTGTAVRISEPNFVFFCRYFEDVRQQERQFNLAANEITLINPNTRTMPVFRTRNDADLTRKIYKTSPVLINEQLNENAWQIRFMQGLFNMTTDSNLFVDRPTDGYVPLYEAKMFYHFDHRYSTYENASQANLNAGILPQPIEAQKRNPDFHVLTRYWVPKSEVEQLTQEWKHRWFLCFRDITSNVVERTAIFSIIPKVGVGNNAPILFSEIKDIKLIASLLGNLNSLVFDYVTRQKIAGTHMNFFFVKQLPILPPSVYTLADIDFISPRVLELVYTAYDLRPFAEDMGYHGEPFRWDEARRAQLRAELDAYYARLYGLTRDELRYILDPKEVHGEDFPGETFRVLKEKEIKQFGEYRTRRLVLEAWDALEGTQVVSERTPVVTVSAKEESKGERRAPTAKAIVQEETKAAEDNPAQSVMSDFGLYKCQTCGKRVMGFEKENHMKDVHRGQTIEWTKVR